MLHNTLVITFSEPYADRLAAVYPYEIVKQITDPGAIRYAELPHQPGEVLPYIRVNEGRSGRPLVFIPGFVEGVLAKAPFAADLASRGFDVVLPDQNRAVILKNSSDIRKGGAYSQAMNYLAVLEAENLRGGIDFAAHSYGCLILGKMAEIKPEAFDDSVAVLLAPAGLSHESRAELSTRFNMMLGSELSSKKDFPDENGEMSKAGNGHFQANVARAVRETVDLAKQQVDHINLLRLTAGRLAVVSYAEDQLYPQDVLYPRMQEVVRAGGSWSVPVAFRETDGVLRLDTGATHNDEQFNPSRVGAAVAQILRAA